MFRVSGRGFEMSRYQIDRDRETVGEEITTETGERRRKKFCEREAPGPAGGQDSGSFIYLLYQPI